MRWSVLALALSAMALGGCKNPLVGKWESKEEVAPCGNNVEFEIEDNELMGDGDVCGCNFDVEAEDNGDDEYEIDLELCDGSKLSGVDCTLDGDELECEDILVGGGDLTFEKQD